MSKSFGAFFLMFAFGVAGVSAADIKHSCLGLGEWQKAQTIKGSFDFKRRTPTDVELWIKDESKVASARQRNEAALVAVQAGKCVGLRRGFRQSGSVQLPFQESTLTALKLSEQQDLVQVVSSYSHGYTEQVGEVFEFDATTTKFRSVWRAVLTDIAPNAIDPAPVRTVEAMIPPGAATAQLVVSGGGSKVVYKWNPTRRSFRP